MRRAVALLAISLAVAGCGGGASRPRFEPAADWHLLSGDGELAAANVPFAGRDRSLSSPPSRTVATLPRSGVVIWAMFSRAGKDSRRALPLRLTGAARSNPFEGFSWAPAVSLPRCFAASGSVRRLAGRLDGYDVDLYVLLGTDRPSSAQLEAVDAELARLRL